LHGILCEIAGRLATQAQRGGGLGRLLTKNPQPAPSDWGGGKGKGSHQYAYLKVETPTKGVQVVWASVSDFQGQINTLTNR